MNIPPYAENAKTFTVFIGDKPITVSKDNPKWPEIETLFKGGKYEEAIALMSPSTVSKLVEKAVSEINFQDGEIRIQNGVVTVDGIVMDNFLTQKLVDQVSRFGGSASIKPLANFMRKLLENPRVRVREELYKFLSHGEMPITEDGDFLGYRSVRLREDGQLWSWTCGNPRLVRGIVDSEGYVRNSIGDSPLLEEGGANTDSSVECSYGLHVGTRGYAENFGSGASKRMIVVKVDPRHVRSVPHADATKLRTLGYTVLSFYTNPLLQTVSTNEGGEIEGGEVEVSMGSLSNGIQNPFTRGFEDFINNVSANPYPPSSLDAQRYKAGQSRAGEFFSQGEKADKSATNPYDKETEPKPYALWQEGYNETWGDENRWDDEDYDDEDDHDDEDDSDCRCRDVYSQSPAEKVEVKQGLATKAHDSVDIRIDRYVSRQLENAQSPSLRKISNSLSPLTLSLDELIRRLEGLGYSVIRNDDQPRSLWEVRA